MIKSIQRRLVAINPSLFFGTVDIDEVIVAKTVVLLEGQSVNFQQGGGKISTCFIKPYVFSLSSTQVRVGWSIRELNSVLTEFSSVSVLVLEYI